MAVIIQIPDDIGDAMRIPQPEIDREIYRELALVMYARWGLFMGLACRLGGFSKRQFPFSPRSVASGLEPCTDRLLP